MSQDFVAADGHRWWLDSRKCSHDNLRVGAVAGEGQGGVMNGGQILGFLWTVAAAFFVLSMLIAAVGLPWWRRHERAQQQATDNQLRLLKADTTNDHIWDGA